jgi:transcription initiation factor IIE alpha subunit
MLNKDTKVDIDCPNCKHKLTLTIGQLQSGETITCPNCHLKLDTSEVQKSLAKLERDLKDAGKRLNKTTNINFKL